MRTISKTMLMAFIASHNDAYGALTDFFNIVSKARWNCFADLKQDFPSADLVKGTDRVVFDVLGNRYRVVAVVDFERHGVLMRFVGTHAEYDKLGKRIGTV